MFRSSCSVILVTIKTRGYSSTAVPLISGHAKPNFKQLKHSSKVPAEPFETTILPEFNSTTVISGGEIDSKRIQLLERLALVNLDSEEALDTLKCSIQFADKIAHIDTESVEPLYSVLETESLLLRVDCVTEGNCQEDILRNSKVTDEDYFVSPPGNIPLEQEENILVLDSAIDI